MALIFSCLINHSGSHLRVAALKNTVMKTLTDLSNTEKGKLLADLFPEQIAPILDAIIVSCQYLKDNETAIRKGLDESSLVSTAFWFRLAAEAERVIGKYRHSLERSSKVFSDQLFFGNIAVFTIDCIANHAKKQSGDQKFKMAVALLFN
jgi:hypothetical protein